MTFKEKLASEYPDHYVGEKYLGGVCGCPSTYGYENEIMCYHDCTECWNREMNEKQCEEEAENGYVISPKNCVHNMLESDEESCNSCNTSPFGENPPTNFVEATGDDDVDEAIKETVNHPDHYNNGVEAIVEMEEIFGLKAVMNFCLLNVWKYRKRAIYKNGEEDMKKADWYCAKYIELKNKFES